jgi:pimeloyl-ACP methyl ester carboxylesterase
MPTVSTARALTVLKSLSAERASVAHRDASGLAHAARGMLTQRDASVIETLPHIKAPSLVVVGADDTPSWRRPTTWRRKFPAHGKW